MSWDTVVYYAGYVAALILCRGLGNIFFVPMLLNIGFNLAMQGGLLGGWDIRLVMLSYGFLFFVWVSALSGVFDRVTVVVLLAVDLLVVYWNLAPQFQMVGTGGSFWDKTSTSIIQVWLVSILVVSLSAIFKSSFVSKLERGYSELLIVPKRRFLIPIAMWAAMIVLPDYMGNIVPDFVKQNRFKIAGQLLVWGWVAFELPFYLMYKRLPDNGD